MYKSLVAFVIMSAITVPAAAQTPPPATNQTQPVKPQTVKKRVCQVLEDDDPYSRLGSRKICKTVEVPADQQGGAPTSPPPPTNGTGNIL